MGRYVDVTFDCLPLRSVGRFDVPLDASPAEQALCARIRRAAEVHGSHNTYYLCNARCVFHLTNHDQVGMIEFAFEGTVLTDPEDRKTVSSDLQVELRQAVCDWLTAPVVRWLSETVAQAVKVEFDRYIAAGDLEKTIQRQQRIRAESDAQGGFMGMDL